MSMSDDSAGEPAPAQVSVLVPVLNEGDGVREVIAAMQRQRFPGGGVEFLFADGRSQDSTRARLEEAAVEDPRIRVLDNPRRGTASGLNVCLRAARGEFVARMDAHTVYPPDYLALGVARLRGGDVDWVAGPQMPEGTGPIGGAVAAALQSWLGRGGSRKWEAAELGDRGEEYDLDTGVFCGVWRHEDLLEIGGFDEGWPRNQDSELAARFLRQGRRIVCVPAMGAHYRPRESLTGLWRQYRLYGVYRARTARRHPSSLRRSAVLPPLLVLDLALAMLGPPAARRAAHAALAAYVSALFGASAQALSRERRVRSALLLPLVLATMHLAHGVGFLEGTRRWGVPWAALLRVAGLRSDPEDEAPYRGPIFAPSLED
jgi:succinoglycan biosynthesis protein ExoA